MVLDGSSPRVTFASFGASGGAAVETDRTRSSTGSRGGPTVGGQEFVVAPMPGRIVRVLVTPGAEVETGAPMIVIEAMKMENELRANHAGTVAEIFVHPGDAVDGGAKLIRLA
jgi:biotin carboxyl carrier protein